MRIYPKAVGVVQPLLSAAECRAQCRIDDDARDAELLALAAAAQAHVEARTGCWLTPRLARAEAAAWADWQVMKSPVRTLQAVRYVDADGGAAEIATADVIVRDRFGVSEIALGGGVRPRLWPGSRILVEMVIGAEALAVAPDLRAAVLLMLGHMERNREAVAAGAGAAEVPLGVEALCAPHRLWGLA